MKNLDFGQSERSPAKLAKTGSNERGGTGTAQEKASKLQDDIMGAIQTLNYSLFIDLGGTSEVDLNFHKQVGGM